MINSLAIYFLIFSTPIPRNSGHFMPGLALVPLGPGSDNWSLPPMGLAVAVAVAATPILVWLSGDQGWKGNGMKLPSLVPSDN